MEKLVLDLKNAKKNISLFQPYINYLRFPTPFKGIAKGTQIDFDFPMTALVGANGASKTSILQALAGAPHGYSPGNYWFSTDLDCIQQEVALSLITAFNLPTDAKREVEAVKKRINRWGAPDYWEPAEAAKTQKMIPPKDCEDLTEEELMYASGSLDRWSGIKKEVLFINCSENRSAFSLYLNRWPTQPKDLAERKRIIRKQAAKINEIFNKGLKSYKPRKNDRILGKENIKLSDEAVEALRDILGKTYSEVHLLHHNLYGWQEGYSLIYAQDDNENRYSDANAGAGEISTALLVHRVLSANEKTLILLDELGSFLHPDARRKLLKFLLKITLQKKHQIVFSTHDRELLDCLPPEAIKLIERDGDGGYSEIKYQSTHRDHAFSKIGGIVRKKQIFCEDTLAEEIIRAALRQHYPDLLKCVEIKFLGGESIVLSRIPEFSQYGTKALLYLDGDQRPKNFSKVKVETLSLANWKKEIEDKLLKDGLNVQGDDNAKFAKIKDIIVPWLNEHLDFLPSDYCPEGLILSLLEEEKKIDLRGMDLKIGKDCKKKVLDLIRTERALTDDEPDPTSKEIDEFLKRSVAEVARKSKLVFSSIAKRIKQFIDKG